MTAELRAAINQVLLAYETAIRPGTLSDSDLWPALAELRRVVDEQITREHPLYHGEGAQHASKSPRYYRAVWTSWGSTVEFSRLEVSDTGWTWREATKDEEQALGHIGRGVFYEP